MLVSRGQLKSLILEEMTRLDEDCGCGGGGESSNMLPPKDDYSLSMSHQSAAGGDKLLSKEEALNVVMMVAANTSCPVTSAALMDVVDNLSHQEKEDVDFDWHNPKYGHAKGNIDDLDPQGAFSLGFGMGDSGDFADADGDDEYGRARG